MAVTFLTNEDEVRILETVKNTKRNYEHIATLTVAPDADGNLPQNVVFSADKNGNALSLADFFIKAYAGFVDGNKSTLYMTVNGGSAISNGAIGSISTSRRYFNIFFRQETDGCRRVEYTSSSPSDVYFNASTVMEQSRLIPPMDEACKPPITNIKLFTQVPADGTKAWVEGSTFELWGVRANP